MSSEFEKYASILRVQVGKESNENLRVLSYEPEKKVKGTLVLIPGFGSLPSAWDKLLLRMKDDYRIYVIESREKHTAELKKKPDLTFNRFAKDIAQVMDYLMLDECFMVASSMGAAFILRSLSLKLMDPTYTFLVGPIQKTEIPDWSWPFVYICYPIVWKLLIKPFAKFYIKYFYLDRTQKEQLKKYYGYFDSYDVKKVRKTLIKIRKFRITEEELGTIESKCIMVGAEKDKAHEAEWTKNVHNAVKNSEYFDLETNVAAHSEPLVDLIEKILTRDKK
ncbi:MAG: alpha/beta hydrolase [Candidatus Heimdallarchaeota archaeon]|nr:alpha/beta hydrolase [Candidatus Heimdallarchaeota archaeon]MCK4878890.1 alpha/beta hydrolase [Candidatus Heimdallarchaeota archaeon]